MPRSTWLLLAALLGPMPAIVAWGIFALLLGASENRAAEGFILPLVLIMLVGQYLLVRLAYRVPACPDEFGLVAYASAIGIPGVLSAISYQDLNVMGMTLLWTAGAAIAGLPMLVAWYRGRS